MTKNKIKIYDNNFSHAKYSTDFQNSEFIDWIRDFENDLEDICFVTDNYLFNQINGKNLIGWLLEPRGINNDQYERIKKDHSRFKKILTYDKQLIESNEKFIFYPHCGCWIKPEDHKIYDKNKLLSFISSTKNFTEGHRLRSLVRDTMNPKIDSFGRGHNPINYKLDALKDYMFSIVIENSKFDYYFTEKIMDCFVTGTIPIYWGCPSIGDFFDMNGIITFNDINELNEIISNISSELYYSKIESIKNNLNKSKDYLISEDWIYKNTNIFNK